MSSGRTRRLGAGVLALAVLGVAACTSAAPQTSDSPVAQWAEQRAVPIPEDPADQGPDLAEISRATRGADIIGLGEPGHTISEVSTLQARYLRHLVTHESVRALALEMDWTLALDVNSYVLGERNDLADVLRGQEQIWQTQEFRAVLEWLREYNDAHEDDVQVAGTEYFATGPAAYDAVESYIAAHAPDRLAELRQDLNQLRPPDRDIGAHLQAYLEIEDKTGHLDAAESVETLVEASGRGTEHDLALHHARQIHAWHEGFSLPWAEIPRYRDEKAAENVRWWQRHTEARTVYWASSAHVASVAELTITEPGAPDTTFAAAGSFLEDWYGQGYVSVGFTFDRGVHVTDDGTPVQLPPAASNWFEQPLADLPIPQFVLALDGEVPPPVWDWFEAPLVTRGRLEYGTDSLALGGTLRGWFDVIVHTQAVTPADPL